MLRIPTLKDTLTYIKNTGVIVDQVIDIPLQNFRGQVND